MRRLDRQTRLAEVGEAGHARLVAARVDVPVTGFAGEVAARYLAGAGVGHLRVMDERVAAAARAADADVTVDVIASLERKSAAIPIDIRDRSARELAAGARLALRALRSALDGST